LYGLDDDTELLLLLLLLSMCISREVCSMARNIADDSNMADDRSIDTWVGGDMTVLEEETAADRLSG
jgi:hypothetical protein